MDIYKTHIHWEGAMSSKDTLQPTACKGKRFIRRQDLTPDIRLKIAYAALMERGEQLPNWPQSSGFAEPLSTC